MCRDVLLVAFRARLSLPRWRFARKRSIERGHSNSERCFRCVRQPMRVPFRVSDASINEGRLTLEFQIFLARIRIVQGFVPAVKVLVSPNSVVSAQKRSSADESIRFVGHWWGK
jgi:hypothetical protein